MDSAIAQEKAAWVLYTLAYNYEPNQIKIAKAGAVPVLISLLSTSTSDAVKDATGLALCILAKNDINQVIIGEEGGMKPLISLISSTNIEVQQEVAWTLALMTKNLQSRKYLHSQGWNLLIKLLKDSNHMVQLHAAMILSELKAHGSGNHSSDSILFQQSDSSPFLSRRSSSPLTSSYFPDANNSGGSSGLHSGSSLDDATNSSDRDTTVKVKCFFGPSDNQDIRILLNVSVAITVDELSDKIEQVYEKNGILIKFKDEEDDFVLLSSNKVLKYVFLNARKGIVRLFIFDKIGSPKKKKLSESTSSISIEIDPNKKLSESTSSSSSAPKDVSYAIINASDLTCVGNLARGHFGEVLLATWNGMEVACKLVRKDTVKKDKWDILQQEIEILSKLRHPKVILFLGVALDNKNCKYIICEYMKNGCLYDLVHNSFKRSQYVTPSLKFRIARDIAQGMSYLHGLRIIHRDLHSKNILLDGKFTAKVADFGLSKIIREDETYSYTHGAAAYMSPEVIKGSKCTTEADVFSYGVVLYELVTGLPPYPEGNTIYQWVNSVAAGSRLTFPHDIDDCWSELITKCWDQTPSKRPKFSESSILAMVSSCENEKKTIPKKLNNELLSENGSLHASSNGSSDSYDVSLPISETYKAAVGGGSEGEPPT